MTHPTQSAPRIHGGLEQDRRERDWDRDWGLVEALRATGQLGPTLTILAMAAIGVYVGGWMASTGDGLAGLGVSAVALLGGVLAVDTHLCKGTPATAHECRRCRRETDRWRGPTRDDQWVASVLGQPSAAEQTPAAARYDRPDAEPRGWPEEAEPAVRTADPEPRLYDTVDQRRRGGTGD